MGKGQGFNPCPAQMRIEILSEAQDDLVAGAKFYERRRAGLGEYFLNSLYSDIDSLLLYAGIHRLIFGFHRAPSKRFPFAIFYRFERDKELIRVYRVLDCAEIPFGSGNGSSRLERKSTISGRREQQKMINSRFRDS
jgi:hypothetical protein